MLSQFLFRIKYFIHYLLNAKGAHALHSPFVFQLYNKVIRPASKNQVSEIEAIRKKLKSNHGIIDVADIKNKTNERKSISSIAKSSLSSPQFSAFLRLLSMYLETEIILETGTSLGINALYLANASCVKKVITIEGSPIISEIARRTISAQNKKIKMIQGSIYDEFIPALVKHQPEIIFLDADHRSSAVDFYIESIMTYTPAVKCIIIHDIYWSEDMKEKWVELIGDIRFSLTIDIFQAGFIFPNQEMPKQHFTLKF